MVTDRGRLHVPLLAVLTTGTVLLLPAPAHAHPFVAGGGRVPVQSLATIELDLAHGCGVEGAGAGPDTDEVALEVPEWLRIVEVPGRAGWRVTIEDATGAQLGAVVWTATTATEPAPRFLLEVVVDGEAGETRHLRVSQRCGERVERWIGTPDAPAEQPAVRLRLEAADPERPAPPLLEPEPTPAPTPDPTPAPTPDQGDPDGQVQTGPAPDSLPDAESSDERGRGRTAAIAAVGGALAVGAALTTRRRGSSEPSSLRGGRGPSR